MTEPESLAVLFLRWYGEGAMSQRAGLEKGTDEEKARDRQRPQDEKAQTRGPGGETKKRGHTQVKMDVQSQVERGVAARACNPRLRRPRQEEHHEFKDSLATHGVNLPQEKREGSSSGMWLGQQTAWVARTEPRV